LLTNLSSGGSGREILSFPLVSTVNRHVAEGWQKTHYLSFSEDRSKAISFASGRSQMKLEPVDSAPWDAALITLDTGRFTNCEELEDGVYRCEYPGWAFTENSQLSDPMRLLRNLTNAPHSGRLVRILLIDVVSFLRAQAATARESLVEATENAKRYSEWLVLPIDQPPDLQGELTAKLDDACIRCFERFRFLL
jgi:hypothetical protein